MTDNASLHFFPVMSRDRGYYERKAIYQTYRCEKTATGRMNVIYIIHRDDNNNDYIQIQYTSPGERLLGRHV